MEDYLDKVATDVQRSGTATDLAILAKTGREANLREEVFRSDCLCQTIAQQVRRRFRGRRERSKMKPKESISRRGDARLGAA